MPHPFKFSVSLGTVGDPDSLVASARRAEELGYHGISLPDHLDEQCGPLVGLSAAAAATSGLALTHLVLANDYRHPVVLAKELATLDLLSRGRLEFGIGAGWQTSDYQRAGITKDRAGVRIERLAEAIKVLKGCFADGPFDFNGNHYRIEALDSQPKPYRRPHPRLIVAGGGPKVLTLAAQVADIVGINFDLRAGAIGAEIGPTGSTEATERKFAVIREAAGDRIDSIEIQTRVHFAAVTDDRDGLIAAMAPGFMITAEDAVTMPHVLCGTIEQMTDTVRTWRDRWGISYLTWSADAMEPLAPLVEQLAGS